MAAPRTADELRAAFTDFFAARGHTVVPSSSLIPHDPSLMLTIAGMVQFKPYFVGDETPPYPRATSVQKVARAGGKDSDLDNVGRTNRHFSFFEMLGNFSFGDYFKAEVIPWAWELVTQVYELDPERIWVTVHDTDDEAERIWTDVVGLPAERVQRLGDADNFWRMGDTGPCGPSSEIFYDLGPEFGPERRTGQERRPLPRDLEPRVHAVRRPARRRAAAAAEAEHRHRRRARAQPHRAAGRGVGVGDRPAPPARRGRRPRATGTTYGGFPGGERDLWLRILADHGRTMTFLIADGVVPSNEGRGYVLRAIIRRAVRHAYLLGAEQQMVTPALVDATVDVMGNAYPELVTSHDLVRSVVRREEERFRQTLAARPRPARRHPRRRRRHRVRRVLPARHARASRSTSRARSPRNATAPSTVDAFERADGRATTRVPAKRTAAAGGKGEGRRSTSPNSRLLDWRQPLPDCLGQKFRICSARLATPYEISPAIMAPVAGRIPMTVPIKLERTIVRQRRRAWVNAIPMVLCASSLDIPSAFGGRKISRSASATQNKAIVAGTSGTPIERSVMPNVNRSTGAIGSTPIVESNRPTPVAIIAFKIDEPVIENTTAKANTQREKYSRTGESRCEKGKLGRKKDEEYAADQASQHGRNDRDGKGLTAASLS